jgi:hypothetical protein
MNLIGEQKMYFEQAQRDGFLLLREYDPHSDCDLGLEWWTWCVENSAPFVKVEIYGRWATVSYSLRRFPIATDLTEAEIDELECFALQARGSERSECFADAGHIGLIKLADAQHIARRVVEFCRAGVLHWQAGGTVPRYKPAQREKSA